MVKDERLTVALFGGSFDPPHKGHQQIVQEALRVLDIDKLIVVPAYLNPFKSSSLADASQRLAWCKSVFEETPRVIISDYEIKQNRSVKTVESLNHFNERYDVKYLIIGSDNLSTLAQWYDFERLNDQVTWVIVSRPGYPLQTESLRSWRLLTLNVPVSSSQIRKEKQTTEVDTKIVDSVKTILQG